MPTGDYWDISDPAKPLGILDPDDKLDFPIDVSDELTKLGTAYGSHTTFAESTGVPEEALEVLDQGTHSGGVITPRIGVLSGVTPKVGAKYKWTIRLVGADGQVKDRSWYHKIVST